MRQPGDVIPMVCSRVDSEWSTNGAQISNFYPIRLLMEWKWSGTAYRLPSFPVSWRPRIRWTLPTDYRRKPRPLRDGVDRCGRTPSAWPS